MLKRQVLVWGAVLLLLVVLEVIVARRKPVISDKAATQLLQEYWKDPTVVNERKWTDAEKALDAKRTAARRLRVTLLVLNGICIVLVGAKLAESYGMELPVKL